MARWIDGERRDMAAEATRTTMTVIALALFGGDPRLISETSMGHIAAAIEGFSEARMLALLRLPQFPVTPKGTGRKARPDLPAQDAGRSRRRPLAWADRAATS